MADFFRFILFFNYSIVISQFFSCFLRFCWICLDFASFLRFMALAVVFCCLFVSTDAFLVIFIYIVVFLVLIFFFIVFFIVFIISLFIYSSFLVAFVIFLFIFSSFLVAFFICWLSILLSVACLTFFNRILILLIRSIMFFVPLVSSFLLFIRLFLYLWWFPSYSFRLPRCLLCFSRRFSFLCRSHRMFYVGISAHLIHLQIFLLFNRLLLIDVGLYLLFMSCVFILFMIGFLVCLRLFLVTSLL